MVKREQESLTQQNEDKENTIFQLKTDLRAIREQLNEEKIRHRRSQVMQSRIPAPTKKGTRTAIASTNRKPMSTQKTSGLMKPSRTNAGASKKGDENESSPIETTDQTKNDPNNVARIRFRVMKMLQEHDPTKVGRIDAVMAKFEGRETELLEKMMNRYEGGNKDDSKSLASGLGSPIEEKESLKAPPSDDGRPKSRQDMALDRHMARMKRFAAGKDGK